MTEEISQFRKLLQQHPVVSLPAQTILFKQNDHEHKYVYFIKQGVVTLLYQLANDPNMTAAPIKELAIVDLGPG
jgi:hypothetical protein